MFAAVARFTSKFKYAILAVWVALTIIFFLTAPSLSEVGVTDQTQFLPKGTESSQVRDLLKTKFSGYAEQTGSTALIVVYNEKGLTQQNMDDAKSLRTWMLTANGPSVITNVISIYDNAALSSSLISSDNTSMMMTVDFSVTAMDDSAKQAVSEIRQQFNVHSGTTFYLTGNVGFLQDLFDSVQRTIDRTTLITIILVIILLLIIYRSPVAAIVPLASIGFSFLISRGIIGFMAQAGVQVSTVTDALMVVTIFGVGTDYCLFIISRFREELMQSEGKNKIETTMARIGPIILASAITVVIAFLCLSISKLGMTRTSGWALALGIVVTLIAGVTLVPALMSIFGKYLFWPAMKPPKPSTKKRRFGWAKTGEWISKHPLWVAVPIIAALFLPYIALPDFTLSANILTQLPKGAEATKGLNVIRAHFPMGETSPMILLIQSKDGSLMDEASRAKVENTALELSHSEYLAKVDYYDAPANQLSGLGAQVKGMGDAIGPAMDLNQFASLQSLGNNLQSMAFQYSGIVKSTAFTTAIRDLTQVSTILSQLPTAPVKDAAAMLPQLKSLLYDLGNSLTSLGNEFKLKGDTAFVQWLKATYFSTDGTVARVNLVMNLDPYSDAASLDVPKIREQVKAAVQSAGLTNVNYYVGGDTALSADMLQTSENDFTLVIVVTTIGILAVIMILLRSILAPLYMVATVLFNFGATMGITSWILQVIFKYDNLINMLPVLVFVMLAAVGADYNIFLVSRIKEEAETKSMKEAVHSAVAHTGNVITSCGIILAGTFATLMITDFPMVLEMGVAITVGVLLDTFLVRALLVPALAVLAGRYSWWPSALFRRLKKN
jgi:putative drug exporter of the RND superfamily